MKYSFLILLLVANFILVAQNTNDSFEKYPVFPDCESVAVSQLSECFNTQLRKHILENFNSTVVTEGEEFRTTMTVFFEVDKNGEFQVLYIDVIEDELKVELRRVFELLPTIQPATYSGYPTYMQFTMPLQFPLNNTNWTLYSPPPTDSSIGERQLSSLQNEYDAIEKLPYAQDEYDSNINIPLSHYTYTRFDAEMNRVGLNNHTAQKPFLYNEVNKYYDFKQEVSSLNQERNSWLGRKFFNEHMVRIKGNGYWLTLDPGVDLQAGKDFDEDLSTYNNTRLVTVQGGLGDDIGFHAVVYESQGRFAGYFNRFAEERGPPGGNPAIIPGQGIAKRFRDDSYDYPVATGYVSYTPSRFFNIQLGHGKNFIGDGYRSLFMSDNASPYPFFKLNTTFWKLKYTNTWMSLRDVRAEVQEGGSFRTKYMANHYLSYNITKRLNIGLFESVIWQNDNDRGFDFNYLNPVIFYRAIEFSTGSRGGNALVGLSAKYKMTDRINLYGQWIIDEFSSSDVFGGNGSYKNKTGYQIGAKYYDAFGVSNLYLQAEYNRVRPYTYSHNSIVLNYGHNNQSLAHTLGANFSEFVGIARYFYGRWFADAKVVVAKRGFEFNTETDNAFYGSSIYGTEDNRIDDLNNEVGQGNTTDFFHGELQAGYLLNSASNLKVYAMLIYRDFKPTIDTKDRFENQTTWVNFGLRTDLFNWYYDF
jgi:hypothetical protein